MALALVGPGQQLGRALARVANRLEGYTVNIAGSLIGILLFTACSWLEVGPAWWFGGVLMAVAYLESLGNSLTLDEGDVEPASRRKSLVRAMTFIREYEATLSREMLDVLRAVGAFIYGMVDTARLAERVPTFCFNLPNVLPALVTETMAERGIGIRDGHMYAPRLMKHLGRSLDTGVIRASILHYNTIEEIHEFGKVLRDMVRSQ